MFVIALRCICFLYYRFGVLVNYRPSFFYLDAGNVGEISVNVGNLCHCFVKFI